MLSATPSLLLLPRDKLCLDSGPGSHRTHTDPCCILAPTSAVAEAKEDGIKGAEPGWLRSLVLGVGFPRSHVLQEH